MEGERYTSEEAMAEADKMQAKVQGGEAPGYQEAQTQLEETLATAEWDSKFESAGWFKKNVEISAEPGQNVGEVVKTELTDGHKETTNTVKHVGDYIVTNPGGETYVVEADKFLAKYESIEGEPGRYKAKGEPLKAVQIDRDITFKAPWGEEMHMRAGDYIVDAGGSDRYGIGAKEFADTYAPYTPEQEKTA